METRAVADITKGYPEQLAVLAEKLGAFMRTQGIEASAVVVVGREDQARVRTVFPPELQWISVQGDEMAAAPLVAVHTVATQALGGHADCGRPPRPSRRGLDVFASLFSR